MKQVREEDANYMKKGYSLQTAKGKPKAKFATINEAEAVMMMMMMNPPHYPPRRQAAEAVSMMNPPHPPLMRRTRVRKAVAVAARAKERDGVDKSGSMLEMERVARKMV